MKKLICLFLLLGCGSVQASIVSSSSELYSLLGPDAVTEGFENLDGVPLHLCPTEGYRRYLDSESICGEYGPGLVKDGVRFFSSADFGGMQAGGGFLRNNNDPLGIEFSDSVNTFGLELRYAQNDNQIEDDYANVWVYGLDGNVIFNSGELYFSDVNTPIFFGFSSEQYIGTVYVDQTGDYGMPQVGSPSVDYIAYGSVVPIPAAVYLFGSGLGLLGWMRRKV